MTRQNVLFVVFDQMRADCLHGALGSDVELPNFREFIADAVSFTNHVSVTAPCGPARASLLTGQYAMNHRSVRNGTPLPADKQTWRQSFVAAACNPLYGYTDTSADPRHHAADDPVLTSYEQVCPAFSRRWKCDSTTAGPGAAILLPAAIMWLPAMISRAGWQQPKRASALQAEHSDTAFLTDRFLADLPTRANGWCAHVTYIRPHPPFVAPAPYNSMYDPAAMVPAIATGDADAYRAAHPFNGPAMDYRAISNMVEGFPDLELTLENTAMMRALYLALTSEVDHHFGRIIDHLKATGQYDNTIIIVTADHGEMLGDHHAWGKMHYYDAAFRIPLMIRVPGRGVAGTHLSAPTESIDVTPTILDLLGIPVPDSMNGRSLAPLIDGQKPDDWRRFTVSELDFGDPVNPTIWQTALALRSDQCNLSIFRDDRHTLIQFGGDLPPILFDHHQDGENRNIASDSVAMPVRLALTEAMLAHRMTHAEGQFSRTMITSEGVVRGAH